MNEILLALIEELPVMLALIFLGVITGTVTALTSHLRYMQEQKDHQIKLMGEILAQLEELNRNNRV